MQDFYIVDTTLRDGEQTPGVSFLKNEKIRIAQLLDDIGVDYIEAGIPAMGKQEGDVVREIIALQGRSKIIAWNRMRAEDVQASIDCGAKYIHIAVPASDLHIEKKLNRTRQWLLEEMERVMRIALDAGCEVSIGAEDASRADENFLIQLYQRAVKLGAIRIRFADTLGILTPVTAYQRIKDIRQQVDGDIEFHGHNDFGMATANALSAFQAGATYISCSVNGLGERAGNTALEEIIMTLKFLEKCLHPFDPKKLQDLSQYVEAVSGKRLSDGKPIVGKSVFAHESGIHVDGLLKHPATYESLLPDALGRNREIILGKHSGSAAIMHQFEAIGKSISREQAAEVLKKLQECYGREKAPDVHALIRQWSEN